MTAADSPVPATTPPADEESLSKIRALHLLLALGYRYLSPTEALLARGGRLAEPVLTHVLRESLTRLNVIHFRGQAVPFSAENLELAVRGLVDVRDDGLTLTNERVWELVRQGRSLPQTIDGDTKSHPLRYVDWEQPANNQFHVTDEFAVATRGSGEFRQPDLVLFVNGIPFGVIECKRPGLVPGRDPVGEAIQQHRRNQGPTEIPALFHFAQLLFALAGNDARYATVGTPERHWSRWRERRGSEEHLRELLSRAMDEDPTSRFFAAQPPPFQQRFRGRSPAAARAAYQAWTLGGIEVAEQDRLLHALARPERLLELVARFTVFEAGERKVARYQQYFCVQKILGRVRHRGTDGLRTGGVVWHTQGSGKSLTMVMLAQALLADPRLGESRLILVTDRVDLDDQLYKVFRVSKIEAAQATTGRRLRELLADPRYRVITTLIHKFRSAVDRGEPISSDGTFVLVDESHRSQFGELHAALRRTLPGATLLGFTGTPIRRGERDTIDRFGGLIDSYTLGNALEDGAVVPLLYEGRSVEQHVDQIPIDLWFERRTVGLSEAQRADLKRKYSSADQLNRAEQKIRAIAWDVSVHYRTEWQGTPWKAQLVAPSKPDALLYKRFLDEFDMVASEVLISPPGVPEEDDQDSIVESEAGRPSVDSFWRKLLERFGTEENYQKDVILRFKSADAPEILIVVSKLLTGFDSPRNTILYLTRSLQGHTLLQAIARVNRVAEGKDFGLIVDYYGVLRRIGDAIEFYDQMAEEYESGALHHVIADVSSEWRQLPHKHSELWGLFRHLGSSRDSESFERHLADEAIRQEFYRQLADFARTLRLGFGSVQFLAEVPAAVIDRYRADLRFFIQLRAATARRYAETVDYSEYRAAIQKLLDTHVAAGEVEVLVNPVSIFDGEAFQQEIDACPSDAGKAERIANRTGRAITERMDQDPAFYRRFSELLEAAITAYRERRLTDAAFLAEVTTIRDRVRDRTGEEVPEKLSHHEDARAYYGVIDEALGSSEIAEASHELAVELALLVDEIIEKLRITDWTVNFDVQNQMQTAIEDEIHRLAEERNLDVGYADIDLILARCLEVARARKPGGRRR